MKSILWVQAAGDFQEWVVPLGKCLEELGTTVSYGVKNAFAYQFATKHGFKAYPVSQDCYHAQSLLTEELAELEATYGPPSLTHLCNANAQFDWLGLAVDTRRQIAASMLKYWQEILTENDFDYVIVHNLGTIESSTVNLVAKKLGVPVGQAGVGYFRDKFAFYDNPTDRGWREFHEEIAKGEYQLTEKQKQKITELVAPFQRAKESISPSTRWANVSPKVLLKRLINVFNFKKYKNDPVVRAADIQEMRLTMRHFLWKNFTKKFFPYDAPQEEKYVYFPLFNKFEGTTLYRYPYYCKSLNTFIERIARCLPVDYKLYVKEHPIHIGQSTPLQLRKIQQMDQVRFIDPSRCGTQLIKNAKAVVTIESTSGFEAFLNKVPVITTGEMFYSFAPQVYKVKDPEQLGNVFWEALAKGESVYDDENKWMWFIDLIYNTFYDGELLPVEYPNIPPLAKENLSRIASAMLEKMEKEVALAS